MADPLSISAGIIAVVGTAIQLSRGLEKLRSIARLPQEFNALFEEVQRLQLVLERCHEIREPEAADEPSRRAFRRRLSDASLQDNVSCAHLKLQQLVDALEDKAAPIGLCSMNELRAFWACLVHGKSRLNKYREELRDVRLALSASHQLFVSSAFIKIEASFDDFASTQQDIASTQRTLVKAVQGLQDRLDLPSYNEALNQTSGQLTKTVINTMTVIEFPAPPGKGSSQVSRLGTFHPMKQVCTKWCSCRCHKPSSIASPGLLKAIIGTVSIRHSGLPYFTEGCNETTCVRPASPRVRFSYTPPTPWIQRLLVLSFSLEDLAGPEVRIRLPRLVDWSSPIWKYTDEGNVEALEDLFRAKQASPWDVSPLGTNLLHVATTNWNSNMCRRLMDADLDPLAQDVFKMNAAGIVYDRLLAGKLSDDDASIAYGLFADCGYVESCRFTPLHKVILGMLPGRTVESELHASTTNINTADAHGRTPVSWAAARGDVHAVQLLLDYGADANVADMHRNAPLHHVDDLECAKLLINAGASITALNQEGQTPLYMSCRNNDNPSLVEFFLKSGAEVNRRDNDRQIALHAATGSGQAKRIISKLIAAGADINARNGSGDSPLRFAIRYNMHAVLREMLDGPVAPDFAAINSFGQTYAHSIARAADEHTVDILAAVCPASLVADVSVFDLSRKTSLDYLNDRLACHPSEDGVRLRAAFERLVAALDAERALGAGMDKLRVVETAEEVAQDEFFDAVEAA